MPTLQDLWDRIRSHTVKPSTTVMTDADCTDFVNGAIERMEQEHDWNVQQESTAAFAYTATDDGVLLPEHFVSEMGVYVVDTATLSTNPAIARKPVQHLQGGRAAWIERMVAPDASHTFPRPGITGRYYYLWAGRLYLVPQPAAAETLNVELDFYGTRGGFSAELPNASNDFLRLYFHTIKWGALVEAYSFLHEPDHASLAETQYQKLYAGAKKRDNSTRASGGARVRGT